MGKWLSFNFIQRQSSIVNTLLKAKQRIYVWLVGYIYASVVLKFNTIMWCSSRSFVQSTHPGNVLSYFRVKPKTLPYFQYRSIFSTSVFRQCRPGLVFEQFCVICLRKSVAVKCLVNNVFKIYLITRPNFSCWLGKYLELWKRTC